MGKNHNKTSQKTTNRRIIDEHWQNKQTLCLSCKREMFFRRHESAEHFFDRIQDRGRLAESIFLELRTASANHIIQLYLGGGSHKQNIRIICKFCNEKRDGTKPFGITDWTEHET